MTSARLRSDALAIWHAAVAAVRSDRLVQDALRVEHGRLVIGETDFDLARIGRIAVVGAGKAGAGMAAGLVAALGPDVIAQKQLEGWINVPADCIGDLRGQSPIHLHAARPAGLNEPMPEGVAGSEEILRRAAALGHDDLCLCLLSGGGSALMPAPAEGISLADKRAVTAWLSAAGATIDELNTVRKQISRIKGGGLARVCRAGTLVTLIISDVLGDPLDIIASGPTVVDSSTPEAALAVLEKFGGQSAGAPPAVVEYLTRRRGQPPLSPPRCRVVNQIIGNNALAVDAAGIEAERRGYNHAMVSARCSEGPAEEVGRHLAQMALSMRDRPGPNCLITGGEPVVRLVDAARRGRGGRNQQLALAALETVAAAGGERIALVSGGTDGEDGPTDAAGAFFDADVNAAAARASLAPADYLARNDAYNFFAPLDALLKTGPTHTNVCDVRVVCVGQTQR